MNPQGNPGAIQLTPAIAAELVSRARASSGANAAPDEVARIREEIEAAIITTNRRLAMLSDWVGRGLVVEAASANQSHSQLCRIAFALAMPDDRLAWDQACLRAGTPCNSRIDDRQLTTVSDAVADADSLEEFVERFQLSVLARQPLTMRIGHLKAMRDHAPANPALRELARKYETESLAYLELSCRNAAARGDLSELESAIEAIDGFGWHSNFSTDFVEWIRAECNKLGRAAADQEYAALAERTEAAFAARDLALLGAIADEVDALQHRTGMEPDDGFRHRTREAFAWADAEQERLRRDRQFEDACRVLSDGLDQGLTYPELEPLRGGVLRLDMGVPEDLEARFQTVHDAWRASRRRRTSMAVAIAAIFVAAIGAVVIYIDHLAGQQASAEKRAAEIVAEIDAGRFKAARDMLAHDLAESAWMFEATPRMADAKRRLEADEPKWAARRIEVEAMLAESERLAREASTYEALAALETKLKAELAKADFTAKLQSHEAARANDCMAGIDRRRAELRSAAAQAIETRFRDIQEKYAKLPEEPRRPAQERIDAQATEKYLGELKALQPLVEAWLRDAAEAPAAQRDEANAIVARVRKDTKAAEDRLASIREVDAVLIKLAIVPLNETSYLDLVRKLSDPKLADVAKEKVTAPGETVAATKSIAEMEAMAKAAIDIQDWREAVWPALVQQGRGMEVLLPSDRGEAGRVFASVTGHLEAHPNSPYQQTAASLRRLLQLAADAKDDSMAKATYAGPRQIVSRLLELYQVGIGGLRFAFVKTDGKGQKNPFRFLVQGLAELEADPAKMIDSPDALKRIESIANRRPFGKRQPTPFSAALDGHRPGILGNDLMRARAEWLRAMQQVRDGETDIVAKAAVLLWMADAYRQNMCDEGGTEADLAKSIDGWLRLHRKASDADWPMLALTREPDNARIGAARDATLALDDLKGFGDMANQVDATQKSLADAAKPARLVGVVLPKARGESVRKVIPADLEASSFLALVRDAGNRWVLLPVPPSKDIGRGQISPASLPRLPDECMTFLYRKD